MEEKNLFEYALIRAVPKVEREEFINVGVILFCKRKKFLQVLFSLNASKIQALCPEFDTQTFEKHLLAYQCIAEGRKNSGPIGELEQAERFRWLTATRSTVLQSSKVHPGLSSDLSASLKQIFEQYVL